MINYLRPVHARAGKGVRDIFSRLDLSLAPVSCLEAERGGFAAGPPGKMSIRDISFFGARAKRCQDHFPT
jgi:hypothetical protein